jgi:hypothetical protein
MEHYKLYALYSFQRNTKSGTRIQFGSTQRGLCCDLCHVHIIIFFEINLYSNTLSLYYFRNIKLTQSLVKDLGKPLGILEGIPKEIPEGIPQEIPEGIPKEIPDGISKGLPEGFPIVYVVTYRGTWGKPLGKPLGMPRWNPVGIPLLT